MQPISSTAVLTGRMIVAAGMVFATVAVVAQTSTAGRAAPLAPSSLGGAASFDLYCSSCHGRDAKGSGPVAPALRSRPADLTTLAQRNAGTFPRDRVRAYVDGSGRLLSHGSDDMPVWGPTFRALEDSGGRVIVRMDNLVAFIESIQVPAVKPAARVAESIDGTELFRSYCATCHGSDARGAGPMTLQLKRQPPDLTRLAAANHGLFPADRVARIIDGRAIAAHGSREMPVWGDVFRRHAGSGGDDVEARIAALVHFLDGIQQRQGE